MSKNIDFILQQLENIASPELRSFDISIKMKDYEEAMNILTKYLNPEDANAALDYFMSRYSSDFELIEVNINEVKMRDTEGYPENGYMFRIGQDLSRSPVFLMYGEKHFISNSYHYPVKSAQQCWLIKNKG